MRKRIAGTGLVLAVAVFAAGAGMEDGAAWGASGAATSSSVSSSAVITGSVAAVSNSGIESAAPAETPRPSKAAVGRVKALKVKKGKSLRKVTLSWKAVKRANGYIVYRKKGKKKMSRIAKTRNTSYVDKKVKAGASYTYAVRAWRRRPGELYSKGKMSAKRSVSLKPPGIKGLKATVHRGAISLKWKKQKNVSGYQVYMKVFVHLKGVQTKYNHMSTTKNTGYRKGMMVRGMKYGFKIRTYKKVGKKNVHSDFVTVIRRAG